ncbi:MAG: HAMP domain-containing histidine kinase [Clostridiales bacterium]|nr:HAMP domain-containing histidine kinase [Clostridiales bacterium]
MSIRRRTILFNIILFLLPTFLILAYFRTFVNISNVPDGIVILFGFSIAAVVTSNVLITIYSIKSINGPIEKLIRATSEIKKGNLDYVIDYETKDEFYDVIKEYDQMRNALKKSIEEIKYYSEEKKQMTASIVHDLKTPLSTVLGYSKALVDGIPKTEEKKLLYLATIYEKATHIDKMVDNLFMLSKIENEILKFKYSEVPATIIEKYLGEVRDDLVENGIACIINNKCPKDASVFIDKTQMERVFQNLIENSIKYKDPEAPLCITFEIWEVEGRLVLRASDNGIGVANGHEEKIFERFYRTDTARNIKDGNGLGLTTAKQIVEAQNGRIWARRNKDKGLSVYISFLKVNGGNPGQ